MINQITARLHIGDQADVLNNADRLFKSGIDAVINATSTTDNISDDPRFHYIRLDQDDGQPISFDKIGRFLGFMIEASQNRRTVLIHCAAGISRASTFAITWLMFCGFSWSEAELIVRSVRPQIAPNPILKESVLEYFAKPPYAIPHNPGPYSGT